MASAISHAITGLALGTAFRSRETPLRFWILGALCAALPDIDALGFFWGVPYSHVMGHRGFTHSLFFAALLAALVVALFFRGSSWLLMWLYFFVATASHGILDAMTNGGLGVAFFAPFDNARYFFPFRPIQVSPLHVHRFFSARGAAILLSELKWVIAPSVLFGVLCLTVRSRFGSKAAS